jgi:hypothetical protein
MSGISKEKEQQFMFEVNDEFRGKYNDEVFDLAWSILDEAVSCERTSYAKVYEGLELALKLWGVYARKVAEELGVAE